MIADVLYNRKILPAYYRLGIGLKKVPSFKPGQFIMLRITEQVDPLLRRPFGVYRILGSRVRGQGARDKGQGQRNYYDSRRYRHPAVLSIGGRGQGARGKSETFIWRKKQR